MEKKRLSKALAAAGIASRRSCEELIFAGRVQVNGQTIKVPQTLVDWGADRISVDGERVKAEQHKVWYMLNKPHGVICTNVRVGRHPIILDLFPSSAERLFTIGRLDKDTTGLLLVTNDGPFAQAVIHPSADIIKEYLVKTDQEIGGEHLDILSQGARVDNRWIRPVSVQKVRRGTLKICVKEGKKHEIRILIERARLKTLSLCRLRIGGLCLGSLPVGEYRGLTEKDKQLLLNLPQ